MAKLWKPFFSYERGRQLLLFLFCLFLAFITWMIHKLSEEQIVYLQYNLRIKTSLSGRASDALSSEPIIVKGLSTGFYVLSRSYSNAPEEIVIEVNPRLLKRSEVSDKLFYLRTADVREQIADIIAGNVSEVSITTDTVKFEFPRRSSRRVVVVPVINNKVVSGGNSQYNIALTPEFITIFGSYETIGSTDTLYTENIDLAGILQNKSGVIKLRPVKGISYSTTEVYYSVTPSK